MSEDAQRCDIWLFRARLFKSRALATQFIEAGEVRINRTGRVERLKKPSGLVRPGDRLIYMKDQRLVRIEIRGLGDRRGPASEAEALYRLEDTGESPSAKVIHDQGPQEPVFRNERRRRQRDRGYR